MTDKKENFKDLSGAFDKYSKLEGDERKVFVSSVFNTKETIKTIIQCSLWNCYEALSVITDNPRQDDLNRGAIENLKKMDLFIDQLVAEHKENIVEERNKDDFDEHEVISK